MSSRHHSGNMSVPSPYTQRNPSGGGGGVGIGSHGGAPTTGTSTSVDAHTPQQQQPAIVMEDCRDYLRTGRCKYGASCKYRHPPNVQSGGGMKGPIDPSEPLYPIRPNEPVCQYYMKHGTCKFGQACKFHHPANMAGVGGGGSVNFQQQGTAAAGTASTSHHQLINGNTVLVHMPIASSPAGNGGGVAVVRNEDGGTTWGGAGAIGGMDGASGIQILPQRPDEPNCIYFLKNGRCKYGATCRYHHPLNHHMDRSGSSGGRGNSGGYAAEQEARNTVAAPQVHYITQLPPGSTLQQGHFVVADGNVTFLTLDGTAPAHIVSMAQPGNGSGTLSTSTASSTSIASSFETAVSNNADGQEFSSSSLWAAQSQNTFKSPGGNSYAEMAAGRNNQVAYGGGGGGGQVSRTVFVQNVGDTSSLGLPRVLSTSSTIASDPVYYESAGPPPSAWRSSRSASFDHTRTRSSSFQGTSDGNLHKSTSVHSALDEHAAQRAARNGLHQNQHSPMMHGRPPPGMRSPQRRQPGHVDEGLSMMTSALLTMLDTPAEESADGYSYPGAFDEYDEYANDELEQALTPRMSTRYPMTSAPGPPSGLLLNPQAQAYKLQQNSTSYGHQAQQHHFQQPPSFLAGRASASDGNLVRLSNHNSLDSLTSAGDSPSIHSAEATTHHLSGGWHLMPQGSNSENDNSPHESSQHNVGLYLP